RMVDAINYMETRMEEKFDIEDIARIAYFSAFHFQRMFHMLSGFTVAEYVRNRKLTLAAQELAVSPDVKVIDVALKYGYDSPESFTKAFKKVHGINPSEARKSGASLKAFPRISFHLSLKGDKDMDYKIVKKDAFKVIGKAIKVTTKDGENLKRIPEFWDQCYNDGTVKKLCSIDSDRDMLGICMDFDYANEEFAYMIALENENNQEDWGLDIREIPAASWAVFTSVGPMPHSIQKVWSRIFEEWFPSSGFEHADAPELEVYPPGDGSSQDYKCEVWIPVIKK
ncbi:MAG: AraC family transcriptional regulator, partial [Bacillota bacterium]|nr:AraC family transcriptional regulator [Bacillota bacterium]